MTGSIVRTSSRLAICIALGCCGIGGPVAAAELGRLIAVTPGPSPFAGCARDDVAAQVGANGGARGDVSAYSKDGGKTWTKVLVPGTTLCSMGMAFSPGPPTPG